MCGDIGSPSPGPTSSIIFIECTSGERHTVQVEDFQYTTVLSIQKDEIQRLCKVPPDQQIIHHYPHHNGGGGINDGSLDCHESYSCGTTSLDDEGIQHLDTIVLNTISPTASPTSERIHVVCPDGKRFTLDVMLASTFVTDIAEQAEEVCGVPVDQQVLEHQEQDNAEIERCRRSLVRKDGKAECRETTLEEQGVENDDTLFLRTASPTPSPTTTIIFVQCSRYPSAPYFAIEIDLDLTTIKYIKEEISDACGIAEEDLNIQHEDGKQLSCDLADRAKNGYNDPYSEQTDKYYDEADKDDSFCDNTFAVDEGIENNDLLIVVTLAPSKAPTPMPSQHPHKIYVIGYNGHTETFAVNLDQDSVEDIKHRVQKEFGYPVKDQELIHREGGDVLLENDELTLTLSGVLNEDVLFLIRPSTEDEGGDGSNGGMPPDTPPVTHIYVEVPWLDRIEKFEVDLGSDSVQSVQERIAREFKIPISKQIISHEESAHAPWGIGPYSGSEVMKNTHVADGDTLVLHTLAPTPSPTFEKIFVEVPWLNQNNGGMTEAFEVDLQRDTVGDIKRRIELTFGIPQSEMIITHEEEGDSPWGVVGQSDSSDTLHATAVLAV